MAASAFTTTLDSSTGAFTYGYDAMGRRISKTSVTASSTSSEYVIYESSVIAAAPDQWQVAELAGGTTVTTPGPDPVSTYSATRRQFLWGLRYPDGLIFRNRGDASGTTTPPTTLTETIYALHDYLHVVALTDTSGAVLSRATYYAYGYPNQSSDYDWEFLFDGSLWDSDSRMHLMRYR